MNPKSIIKGIQQWVQERRRIRNDETLYHKMISYHPEYWQVINGGDKEREWIKRWQPLIKHHRLSPLSYRIFSHLAGESIDRLPLEICAIVVEPILNPRKYIAYYDDKNSLPHIMDRDWLPTTYLRSVRGHLYFDNGTLVTNATKAIEEISSNRIIVKPSCEQSGRGVQIFTRSKNSKFENKNGEELSLELLKEKWKSDWLVQDCIVQSDELSQFNPTSVNTIRIATYRSLNGVITPIGHVLRVGGQGSEVDNAHQGGMFCGIDEKGNLGKYFCDAYARTTTTFNGIDVANTNYRISNFEKIREFVCSAASRIQHHDLVAFDIAITKNGTPNIIEINVRGFSAWFFEMTKLSTFGSYTEEIIKRCKKK